MLAQLLHSVGVMQPGALRVTPLSAIAIANGDLGHLASAAARAGTQYA